MTIKKCTTLAEMLPHLALIQKLSPQLTAETYAALLADMVGHNYFQCALYDGDTCIAVSGYWICTKLYSGKYLEIDNFIVDDAERGRGLGKQLLDWMLNEARANGCQTAMLDAYVENFRAHHFYYREGFIARGFHYLKKL